MTIHGHVRESHDNFNSIHGHHMSITRLTRIDVVLLFAVVCLAEMVDHHGNNNDGNDHDNDNCSDDGNQNDHEIVAFICEIKKGGEERRGRERKGERKGRRGEEDIGGRGRRGKGGKRIKEERRESTL